jgi:hypothetical protein
VELADDLRGSHDHCLGFARSPTCAVADLRAESTLLAESSQVANLTGLMGVEGGADFFHVGSMRADRFVELSSGDTKLFGPIGDVGGHLGIDLFQVVGSFSMFLVYGVGLMDLWCIVVLGHTFSPYGSVGLMSPGAVEMYAGSLWNDRRC